MTWGVLPSYSGVQMTSSPPSLAPPPKKKHQAQISRDANHQDAFDQDIRT